MRFGFAIPTLTAFLRSTEDYDGAVRLRYQRTYDLCRMAEDLGYDFGTIGQHRFSPEVVDSSAPLVVLAALAQRTRTLRLCTNIALLPTHHPIDFAEQAATVDELSDGRLILGLGIGYRPYEYDAVGIPYKERTGRIEEGVDILRRAWRPETVSYEGRYFTIPPIEVMPKPVQPGGPPIWIGAIAEPAVRRAARIGDGWLTDNIQTIAALAPQIARFKRESAENGKAGTVALIRKVGIAATREKLEDEWFPDILKAYQRYARDNVQFEDKAFEAALKSRRPMRLPEFPDDLFVAGTPGECIDAIRRIEERTGCDYLVADFGRAAHGAEYERMRDMVELFGREVIPAFRA